MISSTVDLDKVVKITLDELTEALKNWASGRPNSEEALMNHLTGRICRARRKCNIGLNHEVTSISESFLLHRRGKNQTDAFGSDIAVTITMPELDYIKTACFQLKIGNNCKVTIESHQIEDAAVVKDIFQRCYVLSVDSALHSLRLKSAQSFHGKFGDKKSMTIDTSSWKPISRWLIEWFDCEEGPASDIKNNKSIERKLDQYRVKEPDSIEWDFGDKLETISRRAYYPAKVWVKTTFKGKSKEKQLKLS